MTNRITGLNSGLDTESLITALTQRYQTKVDKNKGGQTRLMWKQEQWKTTNKSIVSFYNGSLSKMRMSDAYNKKTTKSSNSNAVSVVTGANAMVATHTVSSTKLARSAFLTGNQLKDGDEPKAKETKLSDLGVEAGTEIRLKMGKDGSESLSVTVGENETLESLAKKLAEAKTDSGVGVNASYDSAQGRFYISAEATGVKNAFEVDSSVNSEALEALGLIGLDSEDQYQAAADSTIVMDGVTYTSDSNTMEINGLTITIGGETDSPFTLTTENDTSGIYDMVKGFLKEYNELIKSLDTLYNADSAKKYDVLTQDQKDQMSDDEVKEWNEKIKSGLLSRDSTLESVINTLKNAMGKSYAVNAVESDGGGDYEKYNLSVFGINTLGYFNAAENERGLYHIDGDPDDTNTASKTDLLKAAIASDPEKVSNFFTNLTRTIYKELGNLMKGTDYSSAYTVYEDKLMASQYSSYNTKISDAEKALEQKQDYYYNKFSKMESALSKINSSSSALGGMIGM
ncbi:flagellar filament capping protein FliD [Butyrivibrio sp. MC2013]|uniref:flagellar filament capping protein FliD n=1 Tax=Butyrivibrio sp. MC2013 TaxID=1280686 RepID=UPI0003F53F42|nr:flagellar filament capping protein FliD [Butyrivibrio sp. MC2013]